MVKRRLSIGIFLIILLTAFAPVLAQEGDNPDDPAAIKSEMNRLARIVHISDLRDPGGTRWVGGNMGQPSLFTKQPAGRQFDNITFESWVGKTIKLDHLERPLIINFWASWCGPHASSNFLNLSQPPTNSNMLTYGLSIQPTTDRRLRNFCKRLMWALRLPISIRMIPSIKNLVLWAIPLPFCCTPSMGAS
jgi:hypothetical protein